MSNNGKMFQQNKKKFKYKKEENSEEGTQLIPSITVTYHRMLWNEICYCIIWKLQNTKTPYFTVTPFSYSWKFLVFGYAKLWHCLNNLLGFETAIIFHQALPTSNCCCIFFILSIKGNAWMLIKLITHNFFLHLHA